MPRLTLLSYLNQVLATILRNTVRPHPSLNTITTICLVTTYSEVIYLCLPSSLDLCICLTPSSTHNASLFKIDLQKRLLDIKDVCSLASMKISRLGSPKIHFQDLENGIYCRCDRGDSRNGITEIYISSSPFHPILAFSITKNPRSCSIYLDFVYVAAPEQHSTCPLALYLYNG